MLLYIHWNVAPEIVRIGPLEIRWYGVLFALAFYLGYQWGAKVFKEAGYSEAVVDKLFLYLLLGTVIGARLGHVLFYEPQYYFMHPEEIIKVWHGGLASHGAAIGNLLALWLFCRRYNMRFLWVLDRVVIPVALGGAFVRIGNLINSEIVGKPTDVPWAFIFERYDPLPRHPSQIYEALGYFIIYLILLRTFHRYKKNPPEGLISAMFLTMVFTFRFFIEFVKEQQVPFESQLPLNMGQWLSIPLVLLGIIIWIYTLKKHKHVVS